MYLNIHCVTGCQIDNSGAPESTRIAVTTASGVIHNISLFANGQSLAGFLPGDEVCLFGYSVSLSIHRIRKLTVENQGLERQPQTIILRAVDDEGARDEIILFTENESVDLRSVFGVEFGGQRVWEAN